MTVKQRLPYYIIGFFLGIMLVYFFLNKKNVEFDYLPNARVLKSIRRKPQIFSPEVLQIIHSKKIDSSTINQILKNGNVDIWNKLKLDSCMQYNIQGRNNLKNIMLTVKRCDSVAFIEKITVE
ncbi:hypothetical protein Lupro_01630 [Lutibacter profundi]|uniref:DUF4258 domain-containing protein n=1 Tax=Lutibacter profundi TaxID=1622118 RepID=A0A0X8G4Q9_9FLAO|nr:hypothetical protein [Lutibacter profundi]AMC10034.1 hypothetical protein Lupro_01630 [Lutibacter profundi]